MRQKGDVAKKLFLGTKVSKWWHNLKYEVAKLKFGKTKTLLVKLPNDWIDQNPQKTFQVASSFLPT